MNFILKHLADNYPTHKMIIAQHSQLLGYLCKVLAFLGILRITFNPGSNIVHIDNNANKEFWYNFRWCLASTLVALYIFLASIPATSSNLPLLMLIRLIWLNMTMLLTFGLRVNAEVHKLSWETSQKIRSNLQHVPDGRQKRWARWFAK